MTDLDRLPVAAKVLADWLGVSDRTVRELADKGHVVRSDRGKYDLKASIARYTLHLREVAANRSGDAENSIELTAERALLAREQREGYRIRNEKERQSLVSVVEVTARWSDIVSTAISRLYGVPALVQERLPHLTTSDIGKLDAEIRKGLREFVQAKAI